jgi:HKD family nuclease
MSLFPDSRSTVIGLPPAFDLLSELTSATTIRLATAFAHKSGWDILAPSILSCRGQKFLLAGASFFHTEPKVLHEWLDVSGSGSFSAALHSEPNVTFHPKVLIVEGTSSFAIVGSGNLSRGGLQTNVECSAYVQERKDVEALSRWFDEMFKNAAPLTSSVVADYEKRWKFLKGAKKELRKKEQELEKQFRENIEAEMEQWDDAVSKAKQYFRSQGFDSDYQRQKHGAALIRQYLKFPRFDFTKSDWEGFYSVLQLGHLIPLYRDRVYARRQRLQKGLKALIALNGDTLSVLDEFLRKNGKHHIKGFGLNAISKVLAVHKPEEWVVYNSPVEETLRRFGYIPPRGASVAEKYGAFVRMMDKFRRATGAKDAFALDAFFYWYWSQKDQPKSIAASAS